MNHDIVIRRSRRRDYLETWHEMRRFCKVRDAAASDELWLLEHPPVYTLGRNADAADVPFHPEIPVVRSDRGGKASYHGPGQAILYVLIDLGRRGLGVRQLVDCLQGAALALLADCGIRGNLKKGAPGVYVKEAKIASLGLRIHRGCSYHGLSFNVNTDLSAFSHIVPCGCRNQAVTQLSDWRRVAVDTAADALAQHFSTRLNACPHNRGHGAEGHAPTLAEPPRNRHERALRTFSA